MDLQDFHSDPVHKQMKLLGQHVLDDNVFKRTVITTKTVNYEVHKSYLYNGEAEFKGSFH